MPAATRSLNSVEVLVGMAHLDSSDTQEKKGKKRGFLETHFKLVAWTLKSKGSLAAFPDVLEDHIHDEANLSWCLAHRKLSA